MNNEPRYITPEEAMELIVDGDEIHTFANPKGMLLGCDISREGIKKIFDEHKDAIEIGGETCRSMKHGIVVQRKSGPLFVASDEQRLNAFDPL